MGFWSEVFDAAATTTKNYLTLGPLGAPLGFVRDAADAAAQEELPEDRNRILRGIGQVMRGARAAAGAAVDVVTAPVEWASEEVLEPAYDWVTFQPRRLMAAARIARRRAVEAGHEPGGTLEWTLFFSPETWEEAKEVAERTSLGQGVVEAFATSTLVRPGSAAYHLTGAANFRNRYAPTEEEIRRLRESHPGYNITSGAFDFAARWYLDPLMLAGYAGKFVRLRQVRPLRPGEDIAAAFELEGANVPQGRLRRLWHNLRYGEDLYERGKRLWSEETKGWGAYDFILASDSIRRSTNPVAFGTALAYANRLDGAERVETMKLVERVALGDAKALAELRERQSALGDMLTAAHTNFDEAVEAFKFERGLSDDPQLALFDEKLRPFIDVFDDNSAVREVHEFRYKMIKAEVETLEREIDFANFLEESVFGISRGSAPTVTRRGAKRVKRKFVPREVEYKHSPWSIPVRWITYGRNKVDGLLAMRANGFVQLDAPDSYREIDAYLTLAGKLFPRTYDRQAHRALLNRYTEARTPMERRIVVEQIEAAMIGRVAAEYKIPKELAQELYQKLQQERARLFHGSSDNRFYSAAPHPDPKAPKGATADMVYLDGAWTKLPWSPTQQPNIMPMADLSELKRLMDREHGRVKAMVQWLEDSGVPLTDALAGTIRGSAKLKAAVSELVAETIDRYNSFWKITTLLRPSYPIRSILESNLRTLAKFNSAAVLVGLEGTRNFIANLAGRIPNGRRVVEYIHAEELQLRTMRDALNTLEERARLDPKAVDIAELTRARAEVRNQETKVERLKKAKTSDLIKELGLKRELGTSEFRVPGGVFAGPFAGPEGEFRKSLSSANGKYRRLYMEGRGDLNARRDAIRRMVERGDEVESFRLLMNWGDPKTYKPSDPDHSAVWRQVVNFQFRNDPLVMGSGEFKGMIGGATDEEAIRWLTRTSEGRKHLRGLPDSHQRDVERFVAGVRATVDHYLPSQDLRDIVRRRELEIGDLDAYKAVEGNVAPLVHGPDVELALGKGKLAGLWNETLGRWLDFISSGPETKLARHPHYVIAYRDQVRKELEYLANDPNRKLLGLDGKILMEEMEGHIKRRAHEAALKSLRETLYDASERSNLAHMLRWASPFFAAHQNALSVWWKLAVDDPRLLGWANLLWMFPAKAATVIDEDGNLVKGREYTETDRVLLALPAWAGGPTEEDPDRGVFTVMDSRATISLDTMNVVFPGSPWWSPGVGPLVSIPLSWYRKQQPGIDKYVSWMDPYGPTEGGIEGAVKAAVLPPWAQRAAGLVAGQDDHQYAGYVNWMYLTDLAEWEMNGRVGPKPTPKEAADKVNVLYGLKILSLVGSPFQVNFQSKYQFARDAYNQLVEEAQRRGEGEEWVFEQFRERYDDVLLLMASGTGRNNAGLVTSPEAIAAKEKYQHIINSYDPRFAAGIVGTEGQIGEWNPSAQARVYEEPVVEGGSVKWRERRKAEEIAAANYARIGWNEYRRAMNLIDAFAAENGLTTYRESPQLVELRRQIIEDLKQRNPDWWAEYDAGREGFERNLAQIRQIATDRRWLEYPERSDIVVLQQYLQLRDLFERELGNRAAAGGARTMAAGANADLRRLYTRAVAELVERDTAFADSWFYRYLEFDPWLDDTLIEEEVAGG